MPRLGMRGGALGCIGSASWGVGDTEETAQTRDCWFGPKRVPKYTVRKQNPAEKNRSNDYISMALAVEAAPVARFCSLNRNFHVFFAPHRVGSPAVDYFSFGEQ